MRILNVHILIMHTLIMHTLQNTVWVLISGLTWRMHAYIDVHLNIIIE